MSNYNQTGNTQPGGAEQTRRHRRMDRYIGQPDTAPIPVQPQNTQQTGDYPPPETPAYPPQGAAQQTGAYAPRQTAAYPPRSDPRQPAYPPQTQQYRTPVPPQQAQGASRQPRNMYDGYERPDEQYLKSDEALLSRRSRSFTQGAQNSDSVQTRMTQTGYQQTVRQQKPPAYQQAGPRPAARPKADDGTEEEDVRVYQRPTGRTNQRPQVNTAAPARVRPETQEMDEDDEGSGGLSGPVRVLIILVVLAVVFCAGIYFFLPEGSTGVIGALNRVKAGISGGVNYVTGLIRPTEAPAQVLAFSCNNPDGQMGDPCFFSMTTTQNVTGVGLCDRQGNRIISTVTHTNDTGSNERVWALSATFDQPYQDLVYASIQQGNNVWISSDQCVEVSYKQAASAADLFAGSTPVPDTFIVQQPVNTQAPVTQEPEPLISEYDGEDTPGTDDTGYTGAPTPYVISGPEDPDLPEGGTDGPAGDDEPAGQEGQTFTFTSVTPKPDPDVPATAEPAATKAPATATPAPTAAPDPTPTPLPALTASAGADNIAMVDSVYIGGKLQKTYSRETPIKAPNPDSYSFWEGGVFTFRGDNFNRNASFGTAEIAEDQMTILWSKDLGSIRTSSDTLYGIGWTGQPAIIKWPSDIRRMMNITPEKKEVSALREVIVAAQDGNVYFVDLLDGQETRAPIAIGYPLKGSVSVYTQGQPIIGFGQGVSKLANNKTGAIGYYLYSLMDESPILFINGRQSNNQKQYTTNGAFDSTALMIQDPSYRRGGDMIVTGENGLLYTVHLNMDFTQEGLEVIPEDPVYLMSKAKKSEDNRVGIEGKPAMYNQYVFMADSYGALRCVDTTTMKTVWAIDTGDNTDAAIALDFDETNKLWLYTGNTNAYRLVKKDVTIRRVDAMTGETDWTYTVSCEQDKSELSGCKASPVIGEKSISHLVFFTVNKLKEGGSRLIALNKDDGQVVWAYDMSAEAISSPVAVYNAAGDSWIIQGDESGKLHLLDARSGNHLSELDLGGAIQGSPAVYRDVLVVGTCSKGNAKLYGIQLR